MIKLGTKHLFRLTDNVGIAEHALISIPDINEGYCVDDNARALRVALRFKEEKLIDTYLTFLVSASTKDSFGNDLSRDLKWQNYDLAENFGRSMAALAECGLMGAREDQKLSALFLFDQNISKIKSATSVRAKAWLIYALSMRLKVEKELNQKIETYCNVRVGQNKIAKIEKTDITAIINNLGEGILVDFQKYSDKEWLWFEDLLSYDNGRVIWGLGATFDVLKGKKYLDQAIKALDFLIEKTFDTKLDSFVFPGYRGWFPKNGEKALYGQQPVEVEGMVEACLVIEKLVGDGKYIAWAEKAFAWFEGKNIAGVDMVNHESGGVYDGIEKEGINLNQGAESLLSYLISGFLLGKK